MPKGLLHQADLLGLGSLGDAGVLCIVLNGSVNRLAVQLAFYLGGKEPDDNDQLTRRHVDRAPCSASAF